MQVISISVLRCKFNVRYTSVIFILNIHIQEYSVISTNNYWIT